MKCDRLIDQIKQADDDYKRKLVPIYLDIKIEDLLAAFAELKSEIKRRNIKYAFALSVIERYKSLSDKQYALENKDLEASGTTLVYLKSEADREIRKQKRRRCLAMAGRCDDKATIYRLLIDGESIKINPCPYFIKRYRKEKELFEKWRKRWLEIADKFKEAV